MCPFCHTLRQSYKDICNLSLLFRFYLPDFLVFPLFKVFIPLFFFIWKYQLSLYALNFPSYLMATAYEGTYS
ncbi:hypothetical protein HMPREF1981_01460 [Bacteroides pyogenes F0041]|uniref:Uncharacterized protein n=1 Tax=Bacteroides pyogenes F0041 TaxID=1321819 RepID=U2C5H0_9BACE|nr:hypothetical protein HMPREF1981_01460 [Bacteroides pyogenes F0041]